MALPTRDEVDQNLKWDLTRVFENDEAWEKEYQTVSIEIPKLNQLKKMPLCLVMSIQVIVII